MCGDKRKGLGYNALKQWTNKQASMPSSWVQMNDGGVMGVQHSQHGFKQKAGVGGFHSHHLFGAFIFLIIFQIIVFGRFGGPKKGL